mgnify:CR=1 FL=1
MLSHAGIPNTVLRIRLKCLNRTKAGRDASIASMIGALNSGSARASTDLAKQKYVMVSMVKQRSPKNRSEDFPAALLIARILHNRSTYVQVSLSNKLPMVTTWRERSYIALNEALKFTDCST